MPLQKLSIIIVNFRTKDLTIECVKSVYNSIVSLRDYEIILIDNNSEDGSDKALARAFPELDIIALKENIGFAGANNYGASKASGEFILFLNPDTIVLNGAIEKLFDFSKRTPLAGAWGGQTLFDDYSLNPTSVKTFKSLRSIFLRASGLSIVFSKNPLLNPEELPSWNRDSERQVDVLFYCFVLMRRDVWDSLGGFNTKFFMFFEDDDICWRMEQRGLARWFTPEAKIIHYGGKSFTVKSDRIVRLLNSQVRWINLHWRFPKNIIARSIIVVGVVTRSLVERLRGNFSKKEYRWTEVWERRRDWLQPS